MSLINEKLMIYIKVGITVLCCIIYFCLLFSTGICFLTFLFGIFTTLLFSVCIHEISHFICAVVIGLKNYDLEISVFNIKKESKHYRIFLANNHIFHGSCGCDFNVSICLKKYVLFCLIGGLSNFVVFLFASIIILISKSSILRFHMFCQALTSLYDFCLNCIYQKSSDIRLLKSIKGKIRDV
ncbi:MAG: hypothetical protein MJ076_04790 [Clostridia bacterium]|nr:hypothetical protein [Clostridia bacterium]